MDDRTLRLFSRLMHGEDGKELLEYLRTVSAENYRTFKNSESADDLFTCKGFAKALDTLIDGFEKCDERLRGLERIEVPQKWM